MKNFTKAVLTSVLLVAFTLVSCGGGNLKAIDEKIEKEGVEAKFSSGEYDAMIEFMEKLVNDNPEYDSTDEKQMDKFGDDFGKMFTYMMVLGLAQDNGYLSSSQIEKFDEIRQKAAKQANKNSSNFPGTELNSTQAGPIAFQGTFFGTSEEFDDFELKVTVYREPQETQEGDPYNVEAVGFYNNGGDYGAYVNYYGENEGNQMTLQSIDSDVPETYVGTLSEVDGKLVYSGTIYVNYTNEGGNFRLVLQ